MPNDTHCDSHFKTEANHDKATKPNPVSRQYQQHLAAAIVLYSWTTR